MYVDEDSRPPAVASVNGFQLAATSVHVSFIELRLFEPVAVPSLMHNLATHFTRIVHLCLPWTRLSPQLLRLRSTSGPKVSKLLHEIDAMAHRDPEFKCVVFSQFLRVLGVAAEELHARNIAFVRLGATVSSTSERLPSWSSHRIRMPRCFFCLYRPSHVSDVEV